MKNIRYIGLDVLAETIAVAVAEPGGEIRDLGIIPNRPEAVRKPAVQATPVLAVNATGHRLRSDRSDAHPHQTRRARDRPA